MNGGGQLRAQSILYHHIAQTSQNGLATWQSQDGTWRPCENGYNVSQLSIPIGISCSFCFKYNNPSGNMSTFDIKRTSPDGFPPPRDDEEALTQYCDWTKDEEAKAKWK